MIKTVIFWTAAIIVSANFIYSACAIYQDGLIVYPSTQLFITNIILLLLVGIFFINKYLISPPLSYVLDSKLLNDAATDNSDKIIYTDTTLVDRIPHILCIKDAQHRWLQANDTYLKFFNIEQFDYTGKTNLDMCQLPGIGFDALQFDALQDKQAWDQNHPRHDSSELELSDGTSTYDIVRIPLFDAQNRRQRLIITGTPAISQRHETQSKIFPAVFFSSHIPFLLLDAEFKVILVNESFSALTGFSEHDVLNRNLFFLDQTALGKFSLISSSLGNDPERLWQKELYCHRKDGERFPAKINISLLDVPHVGKAIPSYVANIFDITQQKLDEKRIMQIAHYDDLTGLPNRIMFCRRLAETLSSAKRHNTNAVILFLDLDRFKAVNDSLGHQAGDELLKETAKRLLLHVRREDVVSRLSGDEFAILLAYEKSHETAIFSATIVAEKIINSLSAHYYIQRQEVFIGVSIGIAIFPEDATNPETLLKHADTAMYEAKRAGRNNFQFFHKTYIEKIKDKHQLELGLRNALPKNELRLYYQPQYDTFSRELSGAEVLIRWNHGHRKIISPDYFIPVAEEVGLIIPIGKWILETACEQQKRWLDDGHKIRQIAVNISARQFMDPNFIEVVEEALVKTGLGAEHLELEITESMLIGDTRKIELQLNRLKRMGIKIALDDFGTGYSSLSYLKKFPIDVLKIDKSFIRELTVESKDSRIACAIIDMGHSLGHKIIAEGVENETQFEFLRQRGCDFIQGFLFSEPLPSREMTSLLERIA